MATIVVVTLSCEPTNLLRADLHVTYEPGVASAGINPTAPVIRFTCS